MAKQFEYNNMSIWLAGKRLGGGRGIKYSVKTDKEVVRGRGNKALAIQSGVESVEGTLKMLQNELELLIKACQAVDKTKKITDFSFDVQVVYEQGSLVLTDRIVGLEFTEYEKGMEVEDKFMEIELPFLALDVVHGV